MNGQETPANAQTFLQLQAILATISTALMHPSNLLPIQSRIAGILVQLMDAEEGMPVIFGQSEYDYDRSKTLLAKLEHLLKNFGAASHQAALPT